MSRSSARDGQLALIDENSFLFAWERIVLAGRISSNAKLVAFAMKTHANLDGTSVRPTTALLVVETKLSWSSVLRGRSELLKAGLIELVRRGNRRAQRADEYRLTLAEDLDERLVWLSPSEKKAETVKILEERQTAEAARLRKKVSGVRQIPDGDEKSPPIEVVQVSQGHLNALSGVTQTPVQVSHRHPTISSNQSRSTRPSQSVGNATHHPRATEPEPDSNPAEDEPVRPHLRELLDRPTDRPPAPAATGPTCRRCEALLDPDSVCRNRTCRPAPAAAPSPAADACTCGAVLDPDRVCRNPFHRDTA